jgi:dCMP deaminase
MNAIIQCAKFGVSTDNAEIYVTYFPCIQCTKSIIQAGITKVYYEQDYKNNPYAIELFKQAGVELEQVVLSDQILVSEEMNNFVGSLLETFREKMPNNEYLDILSEAEKYFKLKEKTE